MATLGFWFLTLALPILFGVAAGFTKKFGAAPFISIAISVVAEWFILHALSPYGWEAVGGNFVSVLLWVICTGFGVWLGDRLQIMGEASDLQNPVSRAPSRANGQD